MAGRPARWRVGVPGLGLLVAGVLGWPPVALGLDHGARAPEGVVVLNGTGGIVGPALAPSGTAVAHVLIPTSEDGVVLVAVGGDEVAAGTGPAFYESGDCTGPPLVAADNGQGIPLFAPTALTTEGLVVGRGVPSSRTVNSTRGAPGESCTGAGFTLEFIETAPLAIDSLVPPFALVPARQVGGGRRADRPLVIDAAGQVVGPLDYWSAEHSRPFALVSRQPPLLVGVLQDRLRSASEAAFASDDCSGPPLVPKSSDEPTLVARTVVGPGNAVLVEAGTGPAQDTFLGSRWRTSVTPPACAPFGIVAPAVPALPADVGPLTPPFRVVLSAGGPARDVAGPLVLQDATGRPIGALADSDSGVDDVVLIQAGDRVAPARATPGALVGQGRFGASSAFFEDAGCTGPALLSEASPFLFADLLPGTVVDRDVLRIGTGSPGPRTVASRWDAATGSCEDLGAPLDDTFRDTEPFASLSGLTFPLSAR